MHRWWCLTIPTYSSDPQLVYLGCYTLPKTISKTPRLPLYGGRKLEGYAQNIKSTLCQCAKSARQGQWEYFAMINHDQCYVLRKEELVAIKKGNES